MAYILVRYHVYSIGVRCAGHKLEKQYALCADRYALLFATNCFGSVSSLKIKEI
ncbi:MAG: hypothetical protein WBH03_05015 [Cyclobacteriaceae bacterium]